MIFVKDIESAQQALNEQIEILQQKADNVVEPMKKYESYPELKDYKWSAYTTNSFGSHNLDMKWYFQNNNMPSWGNVEYTKDRVQKGIDHYWNTYEQWKQDCEPALVKNKEIADHNALQAKRLATFMQTLGVRDTYTTFEYKTSRSKNKTKMEHKCGWKQDLDRIMPKDNYQDLCKQIEERGKRIEKHGWEMNKKYEQEQREKEVEMRKQKDQETLALMKAKYVNRADADVGDVLEAILSKDKYLMLAHWLEMNRLDWNDGYNYAEIGVSQFKVETEQDKEIVKELEGIIEDGDKSGDIDGRMFRDCKWNYSVLYGMVDEELMEDYQSVNTMVETW